MDMEKDQQGTQQPQQDVQPDVSGRVIVPKEDQGDKSNLVFDPFWGRMVDENEAAEPPNDGLDRTGLSGVTVNVDPDPEPDPEQEQEQADEAQPRGADSKFVAKDDAAATGPDEQVEILKAIRDRLASREQPQQQPQEAQRQAAYDQAMADGVKSLADASDNDWVEAWTVKAVLGGMANEIQALKKSIQEAQAQEAMPDFNDVIKNDFAPIAKANAGLIDAMRSGDVNKLAYEIGKMNRASQAGQTPANGGQAKASQAVQKMLEKQDMPRSTPTVGASADGAISQAQRIQNMSDAEFDAHVRKVAGGA